MGKGAPVPQRDELSELKRQILRNYVSIHAFCRQHPEVGRSTVYALLAGKYRGQVYKHTALLWQVMTKDERQGNHRR